MIFQFKISKLSCLEHFKSGHLRRFELIAGAMLRPNFVLWDLDRWIDV